uniref:Poly(A) polymerase n=2 Tax=Solanum tuberosum TaxID=4113 RepID=M1CJZ3_SOLTU
MMPSNRKHKAPSEVKDGEVHTLLSKAEAKQSLEFKRDSQLLNRSTKLRKKSPWKDLVSASSGATFSVLDVLLGAIPGKEMQYGSDGVSEFSSDEKDEVTNDEKVSDHLEELDKVESEDEVSNDEKVSDQHEELDKVESEDDVSSDEEVSDQHEELDKVESEDDVSSDEEVSDQHEELDKVESEDDVSSDEEVSDQHEELDKVESEDDVSSDEEVSDQHEELDKVEYEEKVPDQHEELDKISTDNLDGPVDIYVRGAAWRQKSSWKELVRDATRSSFSISQIFPGLSLPKPELPVMGETRTAQKSNSTDKSDSQDVSVEEQNNVHFSKELPVLDDYQQKETMKN